MVFMIWYVFCFCFCFIPVRILISFPFFSCYFFFFQTSNGNNGSPASLDSPQVHVQLPHHPSPDNKSHLSSLSVKNSSTSSLSSQNVNHLEAAQLALNETSDHSDPSTSFQVSSEQLQLFHSNKDVYLIQALGGAKGLESKLDTDLSKGLLYSNSNHTDSHSSSNLLHLPHHSSSHPNHTDTTHLNQNTIVDAGSNDHSQLSQNGQSTVYANNSSNFETKHESIATLSPVPFHAQNSPPSYEMRQQYYGINRLPEKKARSFFQLVWMALQDKVLILLSIVAVVSLAIGLYETFGQPAEYDENGHQKPRVEWVEGVAIIVAIAIVSLVGAGNDWQKERQFVKLNKKKDDRLVRVIRAGHTIEVSIFEIVVGDLVQLEPGDIVPCDGLLINGYGIKADESSLTGESDNIKKVSVEQALEKLNKNPNISPREKGLDCFIISGSKILEGTGEFLVTAVGVSSFYGKTLVSLQTDSEETPLQEKLNIIAEGIAKIGTLAAGIMFVVLFIRFLAKLPNSTLTGPQKGEEFLNIVITAITIIVVAVPEGLPLAVTLALAFATTRMLKDNNLVRVLKACETMGGATAVCSDKTGTLTQNRMTVVAGTLGLNKRFVLDTDTSNVDNDNELDVATNKNVAHGNMNQNEKAQHNALTPVNLPAQSLDEKAEHPQQFASVLSPSARDLFVASIVSNTSAFENIEYATELAEGNTAAEHYIGSKTETAILSFAYEYFNIGNLEQARANYSVARIYPFDSAKKYMATVIELPNNSGFRLLVKGASEVLLNACTNIWDEGVRPITGSDVEQVQHHIDTYASNSLRAIGFVYRDFENSKVWPPYNFNDEKNLLENMTFLGLVGIKDPLRHGVRKAVADCQHAGVVVRMVTGDNVITAKAIATDCGIYQESEGHVVMQGPDFRKKSQQELYEIVPKLRVLARSSPDDKRKLVQTLKNMGETVAVTGDGTNDAPALKLADVGFSMGISGTEVAKEASEIILMDDNFGSIVKAIVWGRTVNDAVKKFLQFQLTVNITAVILTFVSAVASSENASVLTAVQLLWVNLIMDTFAALALATDPPNPDVLNRKPDNRKASLITPTMWKIILGEALYQLIVCFVLNFAGQKLFNAHTNKEIVQIHGLVFNTFVWMQYFKMFVSRRLDNKYNMFEGILKNHYYITVSCIILGAQILIMFVGGAAFNIERQTGGMWATAIICGFGSIPVGLLLRTIPDEWLIKIFPTRLWRFLGRMYGKMKFWRRWTKKSDEDEEGPAIKITKDEESRLDSSPSYVWPEPFQQVKEDLILLKLRGGRWNQIKSKPKRLYIRMKKSFNSNSSVRDGISSNASSTTLHTSSDHSGKFSSATPAMTATDVSGNPSAIQDSEGFLTVPGAGDGSHRTRPNRSRNSSTSSGYSIGALTMVPTIVGGAIAGWGGDVGHARLAPGNNEPSQTIRETGYAAGRDLENQNNSADGFLLVTPPTDDTTERK